MVTIGIAVMTILRLLVVLPAEFVALTVKLNVPATIGIPVIAPVVSFRFKPAGSIPSETDHVIGVAPVAFSV